MNKEIRRNAVPLIMYHFAIQFFNIYFEFLVSISCKWVFTSLKIKTKNLLKSFLLKRNTYFWIFLSIILVCVRSFVPNLHGDRGWSQKKSLEYMRNHALEQRARASVAQNAALKSTAVKLYETPQRESYLCVTLLNIKRANKRKYCSVRRELRPGGVGPTSAPHAALFLLRPREAKKFVAAGGRFNRNVLCCYERRAY